MYGRRPRSRSVTEPGRRPGAAASRPGVTLGHPPRTGRRDAQTGGPPCDAGPGERRRPGRCGDRRSAVRVRSGPGRGPGRRSHRALRHRAGWASGSGGRRAQGHRSPAVGPSLGRRLHSSGDGDGRRRGEWHVSGWPICEWWSRAVVGRGRPSGRSRGVRPDPHAAEPWIASGIPHLYAGVIEATGVVGPLVLPGGTACAGCLALTRTDRDPQWPRMLTQWRSGRRNAVQACDLGLATAVAGLAAPMRCPFWTANCPPARGPGGRLLCRCWTGGRSRSERISTVPAGRVGTLWGSAPLGAARRRTQWPGNRRTRHGSLGFGGAYV